jgi:flagellar basal-body rod modification protein FlgD
MTTTSPISGPSGATASTAAQPSGTTLGKDDFLKLLTTQLQNQDPLNPMDDKDFISQMAQFSTLEQITNMSEGLARLSTSSLLGQTVDYQLADGTTGEGSVSSVTMNGGALSLQVGGVDVTPDQVRKIVAAPQAGN